MKNLYTIEVDESEIVECWNEQAAKEIGYQEYALKQCPKIKVKPCNPTGDCISRSDLKKEVVGMLINKADDLEEVEFEINATLASVCEKIDNAQTVESRPQGEWKTVEGYDGDEYYECSNCGEPWFLSAGTPKDNNMNFCPNCGADMRGGKE